MLKSFSNTVLRWERRTLVPRQRGQLILFLVLFTKPTSMALTEHSFLKAGACEAFLNRVKTGQRVKEDWENCSITYPASPCTRGISKDAAKLETRCFDLFCKTLVQILRI